MPISLSLRSIHLAAAMAAALLPSLGQAAGEGKTELRFVCASALSEAPTVTLAARDEAGRFKSLGDIELRAALVTDWISAQAGELHLLAKEAGKPKSLAQFTFPAGASRALVLVHANPAKKTYSAAVLDPSADKFVKGTIFVCNFSGKSASIELGSKSLKSEIGKHLVAQPGLDQNGMYRLTVSLVEDNTEPKMMYDRTIPGNPESRDILFLLPDQSGGIQVQSLPIYDSPEP